MIKRFYLLVVFIGLLVLTGCQTNPFKPQRGVPAKLSINAALNQAVRDNSQMLAASQKGISANLSNSLMPDLRVNNELLTHQKKQEERFNISVNNMSARDFFMGLVKDTSYNMVVSPKLTGNITLNLKNVTIQDVLNATHDIYGYNTQKTSYGYQVNPREIETKIFAVNYINLKRNGESSTSISSTVLPEFGAESRDDSDSDSDSDNSDSNKSKSSANVKTTTDTDFWGSLEKTLSALIGKEEGRKVIINPTSGSVVVSAYPDELRRVGTFLNAIQKAMNRQVTIEAKFLEITLSHDYETGIDWSLFGGRFVQSMANLVGEDGITPAGNALVLKPAGSMANVIRLLSQQGNIQVLQSPRISTMNNMKAVFKIGTDEYHVTGFDSSTTQTTTNPIQTQNVNLAPFFSGVALDVTPQIDVNGEVLLHIHPIISQVTDKEKTLTIQGQKTEVPLAVNRVRESDTMVRAKSGQIVVIGGLMEDKTEEDTAGAPFLDKTPIVGALFRGQKQASEKTELVILLRPIVSESQNWIKQLKESAKAMQKVSKGFHFGGHPEVFGNEAEFAYRKKIEQKYSK